MIISRTPFRISFLGGGTDYPEWVARHGGAVLATAINKYCYLSCRYLPPFFENRYKIVYSKIENCQNIDEILHPGVRETLRFLNAERGLEIHYDADLPARGGLGTSSSFIVGLLHALYALKGYMPGKRQLASESVIIEQQLIKETVGSQDQYIAAYGGFNHIVFSPSGEVIVTPITIPPERMLEFNRHLMLFFTGINRTASDIAKSYTQNVEQKERQLHEIGQMVDAGIDILNSQQPLALFGKLLHEAWQLKHSLSDCVSNRFIDEIYAQARAQGALGGKLTGAGGGGFMLFFAPPEAHERIRNALNGLIYIPIKFDKLGSQIIFYDPEEDYLVEEKMRTQQPGLAFRELSSLSLS